MRQPKRDDRHRAGGAALNGPQDLGGQMGFGPVAPEVDEPLFHADWERRVLAITLACAALGHWTIDESRHARESLPPADYLYFSYYRIWFEALTHLLARHGEVSTQELASGHALAPPVRAQRCLSAAEVPGVLSRGGPSARDPLGPALFARGQRVRARNLHAEGHTRLPRYARGRIGHIEAVHGAHVFPDANAHGGGEAPQWLYTVIFDGQALWGPDTDPTLSVRIDAWESYLEPA